MKIPLKKKKIYNAILSKNFEKNEKFETYFKTFVKEKKKIVNPMLNVIIPIPKSKNFENCFEKFRKK